MLPNPELISCEEKKEDSAALVQSQEVLNLNAVIEVDEDGIKVVYCVWSLLPDTSFGRPLLPKASCIVTR